MKKIVISFFIVLILVVVGGRILTRLVPDDVVENVAYRTGEDFKFEDASGTSEFEESLKNAKELEWTYDENQLRDEALQQENGGIDSEGGFFQRHALVSFVDDSDEVEIKEDFFVSHTADIYLNAPSYLGKTIKYEGMFFSLYDENTDKVHKYVLRYGPGCCAYDDQVGFEVFCEENFEDKTWVSIEGELVEYQGEKYKYLAIDLDKLEEKAERGLETVYR